ncbi:MAG: hypothetical protein GY793_07755 [Proteobacteria bacterium]|nr:hypothetical protein [Pseudomonadota bacterium]
MKKDLQVLTLPFPKMMMSSSRSEFNMPSEFAKDIKNMIIKYNGAGSKRNGFTKIDNELPVGEKIIKMTHYPTSTGVMQILAFAFSGKIYCRTIDSQWTLVYSELSESGQISVANFAGKLIICNGINKIRSYDGETFKIITQYISQSLFQFTISSNTSVDTDVFTENFPSGRAVKVEFTDGTVAYSTVSHISNSLTDGFNILHFNDEIINSEVENVYYQLEAPVLSRVYAAHDRLWAMGKGEFDLTNFSADVDRSRVYYTDIVNDEEGWYDSEGNLCSINLADKMPETEELVAMATKDNMTVFFCRNYTQVWTGTNPRATGDFAWNKTLPAGLIHPDLVSNMPNDIAFFSQFGARTISRVLQTEQLDIADMGSEMATDIHSAIEKVRLSSQIYKNIHSFQFHKQNWFGFKLNSESLIFQMSGGVLSWSKFDGIFESATAFLNLPDGRFFAAVDNVLYEYDTESYADDDQSIHTIWKTAWFGRGGTKAWANKYVEFVIEPSALKTAQLHRYKNYNSAAYVAKEINLKSLPDYFDVAFWDNANFDVDDQQRTIVRDKFVANNVAFSVQTNDKAGPLTIYAVRFYGSAER